MTDRFGTISISDNKPGKELQTPVTPPKKKPARKLKSRKKQRKKMNKGTKLFIAFVILPLLLFGAYCLTGFVLLPKFIEEKVPSLLAKEYQIQTNFEQVRFNPFTFECSFADFSLFPPDNGEQAGKLISIQKIETTFSLIELFRNNFVFKQLTITKPIISISRFRDNEYNFSGYFKNGEVNSSKQIMDFAELPFLYSISNLKINNGQIIFNDKPSGKTHTVEQLQIGIPTLANFDYVSPVTITPQFSAVINGSPLEINTNTSDTNSFNSFSVDLKDLNLPVYVDYLPISIPIKITEGTAQGKLDIQFGAQASTDEKINISFQLGLDNVNAVSTDQALTVKTESSKLIGEYHPLSGALHFENVFLKQPEFAINEKFSKETLDSFLNIASNTAKNQDKTNSLSIHRLLLDEGKLLFSEKDGKRSSNWKNIQFTIKDYKTFLTDDSQTAQSGTFTLTGIDSLKNTTLAWQGSFSNQNSMSGALTIQNVIPESISSLLWSEKLKCEADNGSIKGTFAIKSVKNSGRKYLAYSLDKGEAALFNPTLHLTKGSTAKAPNIILKGVSYNNDRKTIGSFVMHDADIELKVNELSKVFSSLVSDGKTTIQSFDLNGRLSITNLHGKNPLSFDKFFVDTTPDKEDLEKQQINFKGYTEKSGELRANGSATLAPLDLKLSVDFKDIDTKTVLPLLSSNPVAHESEALLSGKGKYSFPQSGYYGSLETGKAVIKTQSHELVQLENLKFTKVIFKIAPFSIRVDKTELDRPVFNWDNTSNASSIPDTFSSFLTSILPVNKLPKNSSKYKYPFYSFKQIQIKEGKLLINEEESGFPTVYSNLNGSISNLQFPTRGKETGFNLSAKTETATVSANGSGDFFKVPTNGKYSFKFNDFNKDRFVDKAEKHGINISNSRIGGTINTEWFNKQSISNVSLSMENVLPTDKDNTSALVLALLYKNSPSISAQFEHKISDTNNNIPFSTAALDYFERNKLKTQISPFLLAPEFADLSESNTLRFRAADSELTGEAREILTRTSDFLRNHPLLVMSISAQVTQDDQLHMLKILEEQERQRVEEENDRLFKIWQENNEEISRQREETLLEQQTGEFIEEDLEVPEIEQFTPVVPKPVSVTPEMLTDLVQQRIQNISAFLFADLKVDEQQVIFGQALDAESDSGISLSYTTRFKTE